MDWSLILANLIKWINRSIVFGSIIMYGAVGETLTQKSGNMNLGTPGIMCVGGAFGFAGVYIYENAVENPSSIVAIIIGVLSAFIASCLMGLLFSVLTTTLRANQNVTGLAITIFGTGLAKFTGMYIIPAGSTSVKAAFSNLAFSATLPFASSLGVFGEVFLSYGFMMYLALVIAIIMAFFFNRTRKGLNLRAVGENPATADAMGINVMRNKYVATILGAGIAGLGGLYYVMDYNYGGWSTYAASSIESLGWLAVALVIFAAWKPLNIIWGAILFGLSYWLYNYITIFGIKMTSAQSSLVETVPYVVTIIVLIITSIRKSKDNQPPQSLGLSYFREDR